ncbi:hypothetical protein B0H65DRAFT_473451, partial [Neurospora tetraspora]
MTKSFTTAQYRGVHGLPRKKHGMVGGATVAVDSLSFWLFSLQYHLLAAVAVPEGRVRNWRGHDWLHSGLLHSVVELGTGQHPLPASVLFSPPLSGLLNGAPKQQKPSCLFTVSSKGETNALSRGSLGHAWLTEITADLWLLSHNGESVCERVTVQRGATRTERRHNGAQPVFREEGPDPTSSGEVGPPDTLTFRTSFGPLLGLSTVSRRLDVGGIRTSASTTLSSEAPEDRGAPIRSSSERTRFPLHPSTGINEKKIQSARSESANNAKV